MRGWRVNFADPGDDDRERSIREIVGPCLECYRSKCSGKLDRVDELPVVAAASVVEKLLNFACQSQHIGNIQAGRQGLLKIPHSRMSGVLKTAVSRVLDLSDEWEYRRLCEFLGLLNSDLLNEYVVAGLASPNDEGREAAEEFATK